MFIDPVVIRLPTLQDSSLIPVRRESVGLGPFSVINVASLNESYLGHSHGPGINSMPSPVLQVELLLHDVTHKR